MIKRYVSWILAFVIIVVALGSVAWYCWARFLPFGGSADIVATSKPLTLSEARQQRCPIELPEGARNISFAAYAEWVAYEVYVRFEAPLSICKAHAIHLLKKHNKEFPQSAVPVDLRVLTGPVRAVEPGPPLNVNWFDVDAIKNGFIGGERGSHRPFIWIDSDRNVLYYVYTD